MSSRKSPLYAPSISLTKGLADVRPESADMPGTAWALMLRVSSFHLLQEAVRTLDRRVHRTIPGQEMEQQGNNNTGAQADTEKRQQDPARMHSAPPVLPACIIVEFKSI